MSNTYVAYGRPLATVARAVGLIIAVPGGAAIAVRPGCRIRLLNATAFLKAAAEARSTVKQSHSYMQSTELQLMLELELSQFVSESVS